MSPTRGEVPDGVAPALVRFLDEAHEIEPYRLPSLIASVLREVGADRSRVWLADHQHRTMLALDGTDPREEIPIDGTVAGRAFIVSETVDVAHDGGRHHLWVPLRDGVDRLGVLEIETDAVSEDLRHAYPHVASVAAAEIVTRGQYTDFFTCARRRRPMDLAAEMQWQSLPPGSYTSSTVSVAAMLEPAYDIGGDSFDYSHVADGLHVGIFDAVGHDLQSAIISTLALGAYRSSRRSGADLVGSAELIDDAIRQELGGGRFATGQIASLDVVSGRLHWINAGHPPPLLIRQGSVVAELTCPPRPPFGLGHMQKASAPVTADDQLEPGDAVLFYSDGVVEARRSGAEDFGLHRLHEFLHGAFASALPPAETVRRLSKDILEFHGGDLRDDATTLLLVWHPDR